MARFIGQVGFAITEETRPSIYEEVYKERTYKGDVVRRSRQWSPSEHLNDNVQITNDISIIADSFAILNLGVMRYVHWLNQDFEINSASLDTERHRITLSLGGVFNGVNRDSDSESEETAG